MDKLLILHFGELSTKGNNRALFIDCLYSNIRRLLKDYGEARVEKSPAHIYVSLPEGYAREVEVVSLLREVPGIQRLGLGYRLGRDIREIKEASLEILLRERPASWKAKVHRADKSFPLDSYGVANEVGGYVLQNGGPSVDVHDPKMSLEIEIRPEAAYVSYEEIPGAGGYPLGMNGKVLLLLSGGIDSPVAAYRLLRRGILVECLHFASPPYTSEAVMDKLHDILRKLNRFQAKIRLHVVPFTALQEAIYRHVDEPYCITVMRRMMMRIAAKASEKYRCPAIATGESVGQVASQTLESMKTINEVTNVPVIRPLAVSDKLAIIEDAKKIGTYEISIRPYEDCCTIFAPRKPKTKPRIEEARKMEERFDFAPLVEEALQGISDFVISAEEGDIDI